MSWKGVELQVALPRSQDAGKLQEQLQQRGQTMQDRLNNEQLKSEHKQRSQVQGKEKTEKNRLGNDTGGSDQQEQPQQQRREQLKKPEEMEHPYKGKTIDITG
ncbi:hypothetical protein [Alteribacillus sp. HJP-4]|uniref:hypothetical protein n=1 Tax=Alteribacillus sp. HJP-4 TaxID=2775394 RepID=UPI0035CCCFB2